MAWVEVYDGQRSLAFELTTAFSLQFFFESAFSLQFRLDISFFSRPMHYLHCKYLQFIGKFFMVRFGNL